jgi:AAA domain
MSQFAFKRAVKTGARLRLAFVGPAGSGKTYSSLAVAKGLGGRVAVIDTERGSASKYADQFDFDVLELESFSPDTYREALLAAQHAGYDVIVVDSLSHAWIGRDGALQMVDDQAKRERGNSFGAWRTVTPKHNAMVDALTECKAHLIVTMRSKTEWVIEEDSRGKKVPRKIGLAPVQRDGLEYEFDVVGDLDQDNVFVVSKSRCPVLSRQVIERPGAQMASVLLGWLSGPSLVPAPMESTLEPDPDLIARLSASIQIAAGKGMEALEQLARQLKELPDGPARDRLKELYRDAWRATKAAAESERARHTDEFAAQHTSPSPRPNGNGSGRGRRAAGQTSPTTSHASNGGSSQPPAHGAATAPSPSASVAAPPSDISLSAEEEADMRELEQTAAALHDNPGWLDSFEELLGRVPECHRKAACRALYEEARRARELELDDAEQAAMREERAWESMT